MKYSIMIPTYNHCDDLLKPCVESIFKYTDITNIELVISANGCKDNTFEYLAVLKERYRNLGLSDNFKVVWNNEPLGYSKACNAGIEVCTTDLIVLLNNDCVLLEQEEDTWLKTLEKQFLISDKCGISCLIKGESQPAGHLFAVFFCVMIHRKVFDKIGLLSLDYGVGGGEDTEFSIECERAGFEVRECVEKTWNPAANLYSGDFPIYHKGEGTVHDKNLVPLWDEIFHENSLTLGRKYNPKWYQWALSNHAERAVFFKGDPVYPREVTRYQYAVDNLVGTRVLEIGCSSGFGIQFFPKNIKYTGVDYDKHIIRAAKEQNWEYDCEFIHTDINKFNLDQYDTIIAFETIEHISNGLEVVERLKNHCQRLIITVPMNEQPGQFSPHHLIHKLNENSFTDFKFKYIDMDGNIVDNPLQYQQPHEHNLLLGIWDKSSTTKEVKPYDLTWLKEQDPLIYNEVIETNQYDLTVADIKNRTVVDIGANIGCMAIMAASMGATIAIGIEPVKETFEKFKNNVSRSGFKNVLPMKFVVTAADGSYHKISKNNSNSGANSLYNVDNDFELVPSVSMETILKLCVGDDIFLKLDCEGAEYDIIMNATKESMRRIKTIVLEVHSDLHPVYKGREILENKLRELGFRNTKLNPIYLFNYDNNRNLISTTELPYSNQRWEK